MSFSQTPPDDADDGDRATVEQVTLTRKEYELLKTDASSAREVEDARVNQEESLLKEIEVRETKFATLEKRFRETLRERELATALAGKPIVPGAATQLIKLWRDDFEVYEERGEYRVSLNDGRNVAKTVADRLASPEFAHFCLPASRGGSPTADSTKTVSSTTINASPKTLGETIVAQWRDLAVRSKDSTRPFGLGRR